MISVQNHLRLLSGSKFLLVLLLGLFVFSCGTRKKTTYHRPTHTKPKTHQTKKVKKKKPKVDTIEWAEVDKTKNNNKETDTTPASNTKSSYKISMFMPLKGKSSFVEGESKTAEAYINYYAGIKMALKDLESSGANFDVTVYDDAVNFNKNIYAPALKNSDVIIGPRKKDQLKKIVEIGNRNKILVVSPWFTSSKLTKDNRYYLQLNPYTTHRYEALLRHAKQHFTNDNIIILQREVSSDKKRANYFQKLNAGIDGPRATKLEVFTVNVDSLERGETAFDELILPEEERDIAILLANWSSKDEYYLYSCLRKLSVEKGLNKLTVYAMSKVLNSDLINYELYKSLNMRIAAESYIKPEDQKVKNFRSRYFTEYNAIATDEAIEGYDMMTFIGKNLIKNGNTFPSLLSSPQRMTQIKYDIQGKVSKADIRNEKYDRVQYFENHHVDILEFRDGTFHRAR